LGNLVSDICGLTGALRNGKGVLTGNGVTHVSVYIGIYNSRITPLEFLGVNTLIANWYECAEEDEVDFSKPMQEVY
jgi:hypothetical protein